MTRVSSAQNFLRFHNTCLLGLPALCTHFSSKIEAENYQLIGNGKKILLFDIADESKMTRDDAILYLNSLVEWNRSRLEYLSKVNDAEIGSTKTESYFPISWWC